MFHHMTVARPRKWNVAKAGNDTGLTTVPTELPCPDWLARLPLAAAVLHVRGERVSVVKANPMFATKMLSDLDFRLSREATATEMIAQFAAENRDSRSFEIQLESPIGPQHMSCSLGRLEPASDGTHRILITAIDRTTERLTERNFRRELLSDSLTALPNRSGFGEDVEELLAGGGGTAPIKAFAILSVDLTRFSRINESLGGLAGDEVIITVARRLKSALRQGDILGRIGGNEFAIFARINNGLSDALHIVQRVNEALVGPVRLTDLQIGVDCAIGCALSGPEDDGETVLRQAQAAVRLAKRTGKLEIYRPSVLKEVHRRFTLESRLRDALSAGALELSFQPIHDLKSGAVAGFEALARWNDPELGSISPVEFIPIAEESGLIMPLGRWAMYEAAQTLVRWDAQVGRPLPISVNVNLSPIQMARDDVPTIVEEALRYSGLSGHRLCVELTESAIVADPDKARQVLNALKGFDVTIAMDDFGTGYSNLASLQRLPIDILKIDRSFITNMLEDKDKQSLVRAILGLAESLHLSTTAEGIENQALADVLCALGCAKGQGFYYAKPMTPDQALSYWLARGNVDTI